uniref:Uncharacterized protein n=1 Tax=Oryza glumipatula TaxID=40148 RepID=A0A0D9YBD7_9ORYZ
MNARSCCPSRRASWTLLVVCLHGEGKTAAGGRESGAATELAISSSSTSTIILILADLIH